MAQTNPVQNQPYRPSFVAVSVTVTNAPAKLTALIEAAIIAMGLQPSGSVNFLATLWRLVQIQVDPETSAGSTIRLGTQNVGNNYSSAVPVQKGMSLAGQAELFPATFNNVDIATWWVQNSVSGNAVVNVMLQGF